MFARPVFPGPFVHSSNPSVIDRLRRHARPQAPARPDTGHPAGCAQLQQLAALRRQPAAQVNRAFARPVTIQPGLPVGITRFVRHEMIPRSLQTRHGGELQTVRFQGRSQGVMTRYPVRTLEVADMLQKALQSPSPRVVNLMNPGDMGIHHSYIDRMPEGRTCRVGHLDVWKQTLSRQNIGSDGSNGEIAHVRTRLHVRDPSQPLQPWRAVEHHAFPGWKDTKALPPETFGRMWRSLYQPGRVDQGVVHCAGGVGRTPTLMWRLAFQSYLDQANRQGRTVSQPETASFLDHLTQEARAMRGGQVLPDPGQVRMLYASCLHALQRQTVVRR